MTELELRLQRSKSTRNEKLVCAADWQRFERLHNVLSALMVECFAASLRDAFFLSSTHLKLVLLRPNPTLLKDQRLLDSDASLEKLYLDLSTVCQHLERCEIDPDTGSIRLPGEKLLVLAAAKYDSVMKVLDKLASPSSDSIAALTWRFDGKDHVLRVSSKARIRAIQAQAVRALSEQDGKSTPMKPTSNGLNEKSGKTEKKEDENTLPTPPLPKTESRSYTIAEKMSDSVFRDISGRTIVLFDGLIPDAANGDTIELPDCEVLEADDYLALRARHITIHKQGLLSLGGL